MTNCTTHHHACDCREAKFRELWEAAQAVVDDWESTAHGTDVCPEKMLKLAARLEGKADE